MYGYITRDPHDPDGNKKAARHKAAGRGDLGYDHDLHMYRLASRDPDMTRLRWLRYVASYDNTDGDIVGPESGPYASSVIRAAQTIAMEA